MASEIDRYACGRCCFRELPEPEAEFESLSGIAFVAWLLYDLPSDTYYATMTYTYSSGGPLVESYAAQPWEFQLGGENFLSTKNVTGSAGTGLLTSTESDAIDEDAARSAAFTAMEAEVVWDDAGKTYGSSQETGYQLLNPAQTTDWIFDAVWVRYRWTVDADWPGDYFRIDWDEVFYPETGTPTVTAKNWVWNSPASKVSSWYEMGPTAGTEGATRIRNVRFIGWSTEDSIPQWHTGFEVYEP